MNEGILQQVSDQINGASNVLVAVSKNPSVDELSAAVGLTLLLNKLGKHATTVFSGEVPSNLEFLQPEQAIEKNTDSLRDFIISLDKSKADKLRYKVEDEVVRIFITPYKTTLSESDLDFSFGDFNVDVVVAVGVENKDDIDTAITAHGRILHDAQVLALNNKQVPGASFATVNWTEPMASSLCEMVAQVSYKVGPDHLDGQMATAFLTGIVAQTDRFRNDKTTPQSLEIASRLMNAGANQQLVADELDSYMKSQAMNSPENSELPRPYTAGAPSNAAKQEEEGTAPDGSLNIAHSPDELASQHVASVPQDVPEEEPRDPNAIDRIEIDKHGNINHEGDNAAQYNTAPPAQAAAPLPATPPPAPMPSANTPADVPPPSQTDGAPYVGSPVPQPLSDEQPLKANTSTGTGHGKTIKPINAEEKKPFDPDAALKALHEQMAAQPAPRPIDSAVSQQTNPGDSMAGKSLAEIEESIKASTPPPATAPTSTIPQPLESQPEPAVSQASAPAPANVPLPPPPSQADLQNVPKPLSEEESKPGGPPPVPPPMMPFKK